MEAYKQQILDLIKAQDIVRQVMILHNGTHADKPLRQLDKDLTKTINIIGKMTPKQTGDINND
jgi:hypothetical protein